MRNFGTTHLLVAAGNRRTATHYGRPAGRSRWTGNAAASSILVLAEVYVRSHAAAETVDQLLVHVVVVVGDVEAHHGLAIDLLAELLPQQAQVPLLHHEDQLRPPEMPRRNPDARALRRPGRPHLVPRHPVEHGLRGQAAEPVPAADEEDLQPGSLIAVIGRSSTAPPARAHGVSFTSAIASSRSAASITPKPASGARDSAKAPRVTSGVPSHARTVVGACSTAATSAPRRRSTSSCARSSSCSGLLSRFQSFSSPYARMRNFIARPKRG